MRKASKHKKYEPKGIMTQTTGAMASMRETAFGNKAYFATKAIVERAERMRDDDQMIADAEAKRQRKAERNKPK